MPTTAVLKLPAAAIGMPRESGPPGPAQESLLGSEEAAPELNAFEAFRAGWNPVLKLAGHNSLYKRDRGGTTTELLLGCSDARMCL